MKKNIVIIILSACLCALAAFSLFTINGKQDEIALLQQSLATTQNDLNANQASLDTANARIATLETDKATLQTTVDTTQDSLDAANTQIATLETENVALQTTVDTTQTSLNAANTQIATLETENATLQTTVDATQASLDTANTQISTLEAEKATLQTTVNTTQASLNTVIMQISVYEQEIATLQANLDAANVQLAALEAERASLQTALDTAQANENAYNSAVELYNTQQYDSAKKAFEALGLYLNAADMAAECQRLIDAQSEALQTERNQLGSIISTGFSHTVGLKSDGTVMTAGSNDFDECDIAAWDDIIAISAGFAHTAGLKSDGTVVAAGWTRENRCNVTEWTDIIAISAGFAQTVGLKSDGTVVAIGSNDKEQCNVTNWTDIIAVSTGYFHTVGLKSDGTIVVTGLNNCNQCDVTRWKDIVAVSAGRLHTVGIKADSTVVAVGDNTAGQCNVTDWDDIVAVSAGFDHTVGLKSDGTVVAVGNNNYGQCNVSDWKDIVAISAGGAHTVGLKSDGTVVAVGYNEYGQCDLTEWKLHTTNTYNELVIEDTKYHVTGEGLTGKINIVVTVSDDGTISKVVVNGTDSDMDKSFVAKCDEAFLSQFVGKTIPVSGIDTVTGATVSSKAIIEAVNTIKVATPAAKEVSGTEYAVTGLGLTGKIDITVTVAEDGTIAQVAVNGTDSAMDKSFVAKCDENFLAQFVGKTIPVSGIDTVSGATISSKAIIEAVNTVEVAAPAAVTEYAVTGEGLTGKIDIVVTVAADATIAKVAVLGTDSAMDESFLAKCKTEKFLGQFVGKTIPVEGIDTVAGATVSSKAIINAVNTVVPTVINSFVTTDALSEDSSSTASAGAEMFTDAGYVYIATETEGRWFALPATEPGTITIKNEDKVNVIRLTPNSVIMDSSTCATPDCVNQGEVTLENRDERALYNMIVCLPNSISIELYSQQEMIAMYDAQIATQQ